LICSQKGEKKSDKTAVETRDELLEDGRTILKIWIPFFRPRREERGEGEEAEEGD
jgi:hypothetical protein